MKQLITIALCLLLLTGCAAPVTIRDAAEPMTFSHFTADPAGDTAEVRTLLDAVLAEYPQGFWEQLGDFELLLVRNLRGTGEFANGDYAGFTQKTDGRWLLVLDASTCTAGTVHHEIGHLLDGILTEAGALTEEAWMAYCPSGFQYSRNYGEIPGDWAEYADFFTDAYATVRIQEDRARIFEAAMMDGADAFADAPALWLKLNLFCEAIRTHFDTSDWQTTPLWERALG